MRVDMVENFQLRIILAEADADQQGMILQAFLSNLRMRMLIDYKLVLTIPDNFISIPSRILSIMQDFRCLTVTAYLLISRFHLILEAFT